MRSKLVLALALAAASVPLEGRAAQHSMSVVEVFPGTPAAPNAQYIVLQMYSGGQNFVGGHTVEVFGADEVRVGAFTFTASVSNDANNAKILIATDEAVSFFTVSRNLKMDPVLPREGGMVCFENFDCFAWGTYSGRTGSPYFVGTPFRTPPVVPAGLAPGRAAIRRLDVSGGATTLDFADDRNNSSIDFALGTPAPKNNAGNAGTIPPSLCGNGALEGLEICDDNNLAAGDGCRADCTEEVCGDNTVDAGRGELCDDGNSLDGDGCDSNCTPTGCGNAVASQGESCDDGNLVEGDGCDSNCTLTGCANGVVTAPEQCDDGNSDHGDGCDGNCTVTGCGNGVVTSGEQCDDGNQVSADGCSSTCESECGNGTREGSEACDDGNDSNADACLNTCAEASCGDGVVRAGVEACDPPGAAGCNAECGFGCLTNAECDSDNPCVRNEACDSGACTSEAMPVDDGNPCTMDACNASAGVTHAVVEDGTSCDADGDASSADQCVDGACAPANGVCGAACDTEVVSSPREDGGCAVGPPSSLALAGVLWTLVRRRRLTAPA